MSGAFAVATYSLGGVVVSKATGVRVPSCCVLAAVVSFALYIAKVGCGKTLSQSPPMTVHFQFVVFAICPPPTQAVPSTGVMFVGAGYGASTIAAVGHVTGAGWQVQFWTSLFSGTPSQLKSPIAQMSWAYGGCAPRQVPDHAENSEPAQSSEPSEFVVHHPTGAPVAGSICEGGTR